MRQTSPFSSNSANGLYHPPCHVTAHQETPTVFVIDDDVSVRQSLALLLSSAGWQAETFESATEFLARPQPTFPSCLVLDVLLPDVNGLEVQERMAANRVGMPIVFITGHGDVPMTVRAMKGGAVELFTKPFNDDDLLAAVALAVERSRAALGREARLKALRERHASLSLRERAVMAFVVAGRLNKQIASELGISEITVKAHRGKMMRKMQARSVPQLVNMAARLGVIMESTEDAESVGTARTRSTYPNHTIRFYETNRSL